jgi:hypothetical protein
MATMADKNLSGDTIKLVRYILLLIKREHECILASGYELIDDDTDDSGFNARIIAGYAKGHQIDEDDRKYLRVSYEVLERYTKQPFRHEQKQVAVLEQIRDAIREKNARPSPSAYTPAPPAAPAAP